MVVIGLTGSIGTGKSTVSGFFKEKGIPVIDADLIAREIVNKDSRVLKEIVDEFGSEILLEDGTLNRAFLGKIVFSDRNKLARLNEITHPAIRNEIMEKIAFYNMAKEKYCIVDAPLLIESGYTDFVDIIILIYTDEKTQIKRIKERDRLSEAQILSRINSQMSFDDKKEYADYIVDNSYTFEDTKDQLLKILKEIIFQEGIDG